MKKIFKSTLVLVICLMVSFLLVGCKKEKQEISRVTVDINPSIELIVDEDNKVVSVTALNDDGNVIIVGEAIVGSSVEDAVGMIVSIATDTGYLVKGEVEASENEIKISVSGDGKAQEKLFESIEKRVNKVISKENINAVVKQKEALELEALKALALQVEPTLTQEEVDDMTESELLNVIRLARTERALLYSQELEKMYNEAKNYEINLTEKEEVQKVINSLDASYQLLKAKYTFAVSSLSTAITAVENVKYTYFINPESDYQKFYQQLLDAKKELLVKKQEVAELPEGEEKEQALQELVVLEQAYNTTLNLVDTAYAAATTLLDTAVETLKAVERTLNEIMNSLPEEVNTLLNQKAEEIQTTCNLKKQEFFQQFETEHKDTIEFYKNLMLEQKQTLMEENK